MAVIFIHYLLGIVSPPLRELNWAVSACAVLQAKLEAKLAMLERPPLPDRPRDDIWQT